MSSSDGSEPRQVPDVLLATEDVMRVFQISRRTLAKWIVQRTIPAPSRIGGLNRWKTTVIEQFIAGLGEANDDRKGGAA